MVAKACATEDGSLPEKEINWHKEDKTPDTQAT